MIQDTRPEDDVVIVGARCSGSPLAALLARRGVRVAVLDVRIEGVRLQMEIPQVPGDIGGLASGCRTLLDEILVNAARSCVPARRSQA
jgi:glycine/D-amino acid oxidase-like deaminating enzyme